MLRLRQILFSLVLASGLSFSISAQVVSTATGHITAEIISAFAAEETSELNFGKFSPGMSGGELTLTPQGSVMVLGSVYAGSGFRSPGSFTVTGDVDATYSITLPNEPVYITNTKNSRTMLVDRWISYPSAGTGTGQLQNGYQVVYIGATLKMGNLSDNPVGIYSGSYTVTFDFN
jgi:hypothetical protein